MITAETVNGIVRFQANGLPVVSLYCRVDPGASQREVRARVDSLLDQIRPLAKDRDLDHRYRLSVRTDIERIKDALGSERWPPGTIAIFSCSGRDLYEEIPLPRRVREQVMVDKTPLARPMLAVLGEYPRACVLVVNREAAPVWEMYQDEMREVETVTDPLRKAGNTGGSRAEDRIQNRVDEQAKRHFRRAASMIDQLLRSDGYDILVVGGHEYELGEFFRLLPHELRGRVAGTFSADPVATPVAEIRSSAEGVMRRYQREQDQRLVAQVLELAAAGGLAALGPEDCLWAAACPPSTRCWCATARPCSGWSVTSPAGWRPPGTSARSAGSPPGTPRTSWTSSRRPSSRPAARPGRSRRTSCQTSTRWRRSCGSRPRRGRQETASHEHRESRELTVKVIVYADFNCVYCFLASQRADRLTREGTAEVDWRAVEHLPRLPVTGYKPRPGEAQPGGEAGEDDLAEAAQLALPGEQLPAGPPAVISNTRAAVSAYAEAITDGIQDRLRLRLFESIWAQGRNMSSAYDVRRVVAALLWPADPIYPHLVSPDLPAPVLHDPDPMRIVRREGGTITPDGGPLTTAAYHRARQWRQQWLALFEPALPEPAIPAVIGPDGAVHAGPDGLRCLAGIVGPDALSWRAAPGLAITRHLPVG